METGFASSSLIAEVQRYLAAVELFRAEGCHPQWVAELPPQPDEVRARLGTPATLER
jgi:hypothetical protein